MFLGLSVLFMVLNLVLCLGTIDELLYGWPILTWLTHVKNKFQNNYGNLEK